MVRAWPDVDVWSAECGRNPAKPAKQLFPGSVGDIKAQGAVFLRCGGVAAKTISACGSSLPESGLNRSSRSRDNVDDANGNRSRQYP